MADSIIKSYQKIKAKRISFLALTSIVVISVVSTLAFGPQVMALVEPHITITMDPGQTTKPFQVNDDLGSEVFSVDADGVLSSTGLKVLSFEQGPEISTTNLGIDNAVELAKWRIDFVTPTPAFNPQVAVTESYISGQLKTTNVNAFSLLAWATSTDDTTWIGQDNLFSDELVYDGESSFFSGFELFDDATSSGYISLRFYADEVSAPVQVQHAKAVLSIILPEGATITRVI